MIRTSKALVKTIAKLKTLARIVPYTVLAKMNLVMNSFFAAQFNYCPLTWMIRSRFSNNQVEYVSIWKMPSSKFLLLNKTKTIIIVIRAIKIPTWSSFLTVFFFWSWFRNLSKNQIFPGPRIKIVQAEENSKMNMTKQNYWTIEQLLSFYDSLWVTLTVIKSYIIYHIYLFRQVYSCNNKGFTIDMWNFKIQNNLFFIASFTRGMTYK